MTFSFLYAFFCSSAIVEFKLRLNRRKSKTKSQFNEYNRQINLFGMFSYFFLFLIFIKSLS